MTGTVHRPLELADPLLAEVANDALGIAATHPCGRVRRHRTDEQVADLGIAHRVELFLALGGRHRGENCVLDYLAA